MCPQKKCLPALVNGAVLYFTSRWQLNLRPVSSTSLSSGFDYRSHLLTNGQGTTADGSSTWTMFLLQSVVALSRVKHKQSLKNLKQQLSLLARGSISTKRVTVQLHHMGAQRHQSTLAEGALSQRAHSAAFIYALTVIKTVIKIDLTLRQVQNTNKASGSRSSTLWG